MSANKIIEYNMTNLSTMTLYDNNDYVMLINRYK